MRPLRSHLFYVLPAVGLGALTLLFLIFVLRYVDLKPRVDQNFFFSSHDPQLQADRQISRIFMQEPQLILSAGGEIHSPRYLGKVRALTNELGTFPEIDTVESLTQGPHDVEEALRSPSCAHRHHFGAGRQHCNRHWCGRNDPRAYLGAAPPIRHALADGAENLNLSTERI